MTRRADIAFAGRVLLNGKLVPGAVEVTDGLITDISRTADAHEIEDLGDRMILPGGVDMHVHFRDPGSTHKEGATTGSASALFGGITTVMDMPNTIPFVKDRDALLDKISTIERRIWTDIGLAVALDRNVDPGITEDLAIGYKAFMAPTTGAEPDDLGPAFHKAIGIPKPVVVHAEEPTLFSKEPGSDIPGHSRARPEEAEVEGIRRAFAMARHQDPPASTSSEQKGEYDPKFWMHIAHVSCEESLPVIRELNEFGFTSEAAPHHLFLDGTMDLGTQGKVNPPIRRDSDRDALWNALSNGAIDALASDHAPHTIDEKDVPFKDAPSGIPGVETMYPLMMYQAKKGRITLERLVDAISVRPAEILGIRKGKLEIGYPADLVVFDTSEMVEIDQDELHSKCGWSPYHEMDAIFPYATILKGETVMRDGALFGDPMGEVLMPTGFENRE